MADAVSPFPTSCFPVGSRRLAAHANPVTAILRGRTGPLRLAGEGQCVEGDLLIVRSGVKHGVELAEFGADVLYLGGLDFPFDAALAGLLTGVLAYLADAAMHGDSDALADLRSRLAAPSRRDIPADIAAVVRAIEADPMWRMSQDELAHWLGMERTRALRYFKAATGQGFRDYKLWSALQHATRMMAEGALVRTAAMDAGFADTAHLSRVFFRLFGLTPSAAIAGLAIGTPPDGMLRTGRLM